MFTGIIEEVGTIVKIENYRGLRRLTVSCQRIFGGMKIGDSLAINGVCLTMTGKNNGNLSFEVMPQTLNNTNLQDLKIRDKVNLERALGVSDRLSGHFVTGHVDGVGVIRSKRNIAQNTVMQISAPEDLTKYICPKGSVAIDGVSLTVGEVRGDTFSIYLIPHTLKNTTLGLRNCSARVNIEVDVLAKQLHSLINKRD